MKKNISNILFITLLIFLSFEVLKESEIVISTVKSSLIIWQDNIFPSLFPFFIISNILIELHLPEILGVLFENLMYKLFRINGNASFIIFLSILSGFPSSAKYTKELLDKNLINSGEATKILTFTHFSNPLFVLGTLNIFINEKSIIIKVLLAHYLGNFIIGLIFRSYKISKHKKSEINIRDIINYPKYSFGNILSKSISNAISTLLLVLGTVTTFLILTSLINSILDIDGIYRVLINGFFEITQGLKSLESLNMSVYIKALLSTIMLSFGGLSVHMQILTIISATEIKYFPYFISRLLHALISIIIFYILMLF